MPGVAVSTEPSAARPLIATEPVGVPAVTAVTGADVAWAEANSTVAPRPSSWVYAGRDTVWRTVIGSPASAALSWYDASVAPGIATPRRSHWKLGSSRESQTAGSVVSVEPTVGVPAMTGVAAGA